jgi:hypothetical protein
MSPMTKILSPDASDIADATTRSSYRIGIVHDLLGSLPPLPDSAPFRPWT